jgi:hypothetical protein
MTWAAIGAMASSLFGAWLGDEKLSFKLRDWELRLTGGPS